jgi:hypothetical protein
LRWGARPPGTNEAAVIVTHRDSLQATLGIHVVQRPAVARPDDLVTAGRRHGAGDEGASVFVLEHTSGDLLPPFNGPGSLRQWDAAGPTVLTSCLARPTSMARDERDGVIHITELLTGRIVVVP